VRAVAILLVIIAHLGDPAQAYAIDRDQLGLLGVEIFFVLSGFLITTLLLDEEEVHGRVSIRLFYLRRAFRIFPAAYFFIAMMGLLSFVGVAPLTDLDLVHAITYTVNYYSWEDRSWQIGHLWSLAVEEQFYLLWPLGLVSLGHRGRLILLASIVVLCPTIRFLYETTFTDLRYLVTESFETSADALAFGCLLAFLRPRLHELRRYRQLISQWWTPALLAAAAFMLSQSARLIDALGPLQFSAVYFCIALSLDSVISQSRTSIVSRALNARLAGFIGGISYSLYLWQQPFMNPHTDAWWTEAPVGLALAVSAAVLSYYLLEKPLMGVRRRFEHRAIHNGEAKTMAADLAGGTQR
jgi:peptidoglycan/LPS O-acetylase OafA/YrhL